MPLCACVCLCVCAVGFHSILLSYSCLWATGTHTNTSAANGVVKLFKAIPSGFCQRHKQNTIPPSAAKLAKFDTVKERRKIFHPKAMISLQKQQQQQQQIHKYILELMLHFRCHTLVYCSLHLIWNPCGHDVRRAYTQIYFVGTKSNCVCLGIRFTSCDDPHPLQQRQHSIRNSADNNNNNTVIIPEHLIRCRGFIPESNIEQKWNMSKRKKKVDRGDIFDLQLPHFGCDGARLLRGKRTKNGNGIREKRENEAKSGKNDKTSRRWSDIELKKKKSNKIDGVAFQLQKVTVSLIPMRQCAPHQVEYKSAPVRISKIIVCHCVNTQWPGGCSRAEQKIVRIRSHALGKEK